jgi:hypothetical protein
MWLLLVSVCPKKYRKKVKVVVVMVVVVKESVHY